MIRRNVSYLEGMKSIVANLNHASKKVQNAVEIGLRQGAEYLKDESLKLVPTQMGDLRDSVQVKNVGGKGFETDMSVSYGNAKVDYAVWVHEIPNPPHAHGEAFNIKHAEDFEKYAGTYKGSKAGGMFPRRPEEQFKFLERPMREGRDAIFRILGNAVKNVK